MTEIAKTNGAAGPGSAPSPTTDDKPRNKLGDELYSRFKDTVEKTKKEVDHVGKKIKEFDDKYQGSASVKSGTQKATDAFSSTVEAIKESLDTLAVQSRGLFDGAKKIPMNVISATISTLNAQLEKLKTLAKEYDAKLGVSEKVFDIVDPAHARVAQLLFDMSSTLKQFVNSGVNYFISTAAALDTRFNVETKLKSVDEKYKISSTLSEQAKKMDEKWKLQERGGEMFEKTVAKGKEIDEKLIGGKATGYIEGAYTMVTEGLEQLQTEYEQAKSAKMEAKNGVPAAK